MSRLSAHRNQIFSVPQNRNVQCFIPAIRRETIIHILSNHMLIDQKIYTTIPSNLLVSSKRRSDSSPEFYAGLDERFHRKYLASTRPFHVGRPSTIDLAILDRRLERIMRPSGWVSRDHIDVPVQENPWTRTFPFQSRIRVRPRTLEPDFRAYSATKGRLRNIANRWPNPQVLEFTG